MNILSSRKTNALCYYFFFLTFIIVSCSSNDDSKVDDTPVTITITAEDFIIDIDENPYNDYVLGRVNADTNLGKLSFSLEEENPSGALHIDQETGELKVKDSLLFDFERYPLLEAMVSVSNSGLSKNAKVTVTVNDFQNPDYVRMIDLGVNLIKRRSSICYCDDNNQSFSLVRYYYGNPEIKNGKEYYPVKVQRINNRTTSNYYFDTQSDKVEQPGEFWIREDDETRKVFIYKEHFFTGEISEDLLYDFSAKEGDTIPIPKFWDDIDNDEPITVESIDSIILTNGEHRKRITLYPNRYGTIVEGIGLYYRKNFYDQWDEEFTDELAYFFKDDELLLDVNGDYDPDDWAKGGVPSVSLEKVNLFDGQFVIEANQSSDGGNYVENNIIENGVCWSSSSPNPTIDDNVSLSKTYTNPYYEYSKHSFGPFFTTIDEPDLAPNTTYYIRSYSKNANGVAYSDPVEVFKYEIDLNTEIGNMETVADTLYLTIQGQVTNIELPIGATIVEKGIALDFVRGYTRDLNLPFPTENNVALVPVVDGSLANFEHTWTINWRYLYDPVSPYFHHTFWTYVKLSNGTVIFGNELQVDADG